MGRRPSPALLVSASPETGLKGDYRLGVSPVMLWNGFVRVAGMKDVRLVRETSRTF